MRFAFTDEQLLFRDTIRDLLAKECTAADLRAAWDAGDGRLPGAWKALADLGVLGLCVPEADGGMGAGPVDLVLLLEETGRAGLPDPIVETALVAPAVVDAAARTRIAAGDAVVAVAEPGRRLVAGAAGADLLVVLGDDARVLAPGEWTATAQPSVDGGRAVASVVIEDGAGTAIDPVAADVALQRAAVGTAAQLLGLADRMLTMTVGYVVERRQFGVPIGSFQAIKHHLADALLQLEFARPAVYRAAQTLADGSSDIGRDASMAKAMAGDAATVVARAALQCHGAIGYTVEHDLHLYMKRSWALTRAWGDARHHRALVADAVLGRPV